MRIWPLKLRQPVCEKYKTEKTNYKEFLKLRIHNVIMTFGVKQNVIIPTTELLIEYIAMTFDKNSLLL